MTDTAQQNPMQPITPPSGTLSPDQTQPTTPQLNPTEQSAQPAQTPPPPMPPQQPPQQEMPEEHKKGGVHFSKATLLLIVILGGIASFFLYLALKPNIKQKSPAVATVPTPTPYAQSVLSFEPATETGTQEANLTPQPKKNTNVLTYNIMLTTNANTVNAVQLELGFDPQTIKVDDVAPGPFMPNSVQLTKDINNTTGRVSYAIGVSPKDEGLKGTGIVATVSLEFLPTATASSTTLSFLPKTLIAGAGVNPSVLKSSTDITIPLPQPTGSEVMTPETS
ncbi:MAG: hypothetical protein KGJ07_08315, partial [Patescibacteria group bacterium]|nr:hypothetical protein [Patescibacteria group bacterium]